jgi:hypothetical protein
VCLGKTKQGISQRLATFKALCIVACEPFGPVASQPNISKRLLILAQMRHLIPEVDPGSH